MKQSMIRKNFSLDERTVKNLERLFETSEEKTYSDLIARLINDAAEKIDECDSDTLDEKLNKILAAANMNCKMNYECRDMLNSLVTYYEPTTDFTSADDTRSDYAPHEYLKRSRENYSAALHKKALNKKR